MGDERSDVHPRQDVPSDRRLDSLMQATRAVIEELDLEVVLRRIITAATELVGARFGALGVLAPEGGFERLIHVGFSDDDVRSIGRMPAGKGLIGALIDDPSPIRLDHVGQDDRSVGFPRHHPPMDSFLGVPIRVRGDVYGNIYLSEQRSGGFSADDQTLLAAFAAVAGIAIQNARFVDERSRVEILEERGRIARDLHDNVIQRVFAAGLELQSIAAGAEDGAVEARILRQIDALDGAIGQIRTAVFALRAAPTDESRVRYRILDVVGEYANVWPRSPSLVFNGAIDLLTPADLADDLVAVVREGLSNVARHAEALSVALTVAVDDADFEVRVVDDGRGPSRTARRSGLANLADRARRWRGQCTLVAGPRGGAELSWRVPLAGIAR